MFDFCHLIRKNSEELARCITEEHGKTLPDARGDVQRGMEVVEHGCSMASLSMGSTLLNAARGIDTISYNLPLGVCAGVAPFNFPAMIPLWMIPLSITLGNTFVLKPSERVPSTSLLLAQYLQEVGLPKGVFNIVNGGFDTVKQICSHKDIKAISFVGGNNAGEYIYTEGSKNGKRVQANLAAKNHCLIMPDAEPEEAINQLVGAGFGASGQRCMALSVAVFVGDSYNIIDGVVDKAKKLKIGAGVEDGVDVCPVAYKELKDRILSILDTVEKEGGKFLLDGRRYQNS
jgi:malonate-semialdehyde dehydrogenase (acetylating) / methylmalonate-semialdehyde dehydrogenase